MKAEGLMAWPVGVACYSGVQDSKSWEIWEIAKCKGNNGNDGNPEKRDCRRQQGNRRNGESSVFQDQMAAANQVFSSADDKSISAPGESPSGTFGGAAQDGASVRPYPRLAIKSFQDVTDALRAQMECNGCETFSSFFKV